MAEPLSLPIDFCGASDDVERDGREKGQRERWKSEKKKSLPRVEIEFLRARAPAIEIADTPRPENGEEEMDEMKRADW